MRHRRAEVLSPDRFFVCLYIFLLLLLVLLLLLRLPLLLHLLLLLHLPQRPLHLPLLLCSKSTMLRGAIRSGAAEETKSTWKAWLLASKKILAYQRHRIGRAAADDGVATNPPDDVFDAAKKFAAGGGAANAAKHATRGLGGGTTTAAAAAAAGETGGVGPVGGGVADAGDAASELGLEEELEGKNRWKIVGGLVRLLAEWAVAVVRFAGVPSVLCVLCVLVVVMQQRDVRRLTAQVEELLAAVDGLRELQELQELV